ncbi:MAG TPA: glutathione transferase [Anaeromyxobacteraceae bacterium]|nr:glutathione transferase [Anaeromyxobacteraceae bacterium]
MPDGSEKLVLWGDTQWESPYVFSAFVALEEKGLRYEMRLLSLAQGEAKKGDYAQRSVTGRVPALEHGDFWLSESSAIDEYLEDAFPPPRFPRLYPEDPRQRARARQVQAWLRSDLLPLRVARPTRSLFFGEKVKALPPDAKEAVDRLFKAAEQLLRPGATSLFGFFSVADADLGLMLQRLVHNGDPVPERLHRYAQAVWNRPSVKKYVDHPRRKAP